MSTHRPKFTIILAGGKGTRMRSTDLHKVCFPIDGRPAINRAIDVYRACGIKYPIVVVGAMAGQVIETIGHEHSGIIFAYQAEQLGTGHATRVGLQVLEALDGDEDVLLVAGDRILEPLVLEWLMDLYYSRQCDMAFLVGLRSHRSDGGRVLLQSDGSVLANIETRDIWQREALRRIRLLAEGGAAPWRDAVLAIIRERFSDERKAALAFGELWQALAVEGREPTQAELLAWVPEEKTRFAFVARDGSPVVISPAEAEAAGLTNMSIYLLKASALRHALGQLTRDNAQQEEYLSDIITVLAQARENGSPRYEVRALTVEHPNYVMGFNDPAELIEIETYFQRKRIPHPPEDLPLSDSYRPIAAWIAAFQSLSTAQPDPALQKEMIELYGDIPAILQERQAAYLSLLNYAARKLGGSDVPVLLVHSPGRANIMGRHVDHQGGNCNLMAIDREVIMAVHPRQDDQMNLWNIDEANFSSRHFAISELLQDLPWEDWLSLVSSAKAQEMVLTAAGDWGQYPKAAILRLQKKFPTVKLRGLDVVMQGNIPIAAGLSSSSAVVVASAEATVAANRLDVFASQFVDLCGEGEWFVGTRGGSADHAAMVFGQRGKVAQVAFFDFRVEKMVDFPADYRLVVCNSLTRAEKSGGARNIFNQRVACYRLGFHLIRSFFPQYAPLIHHLRDVNPRNLAVPLSWIYRILLRLPERATREELAKMLPGEDLSQIYATHTEPPEGYPIRGVVLFGLSEFERSRVAGDLLAQHRVAEFGRLMNTSHNGDRVVVYDEQWQPHPYDYAVTNGYLLDLLEALESGDAARVEAAQLLWQPGAYGCSTPSIDLMVDIARQVPGVMGAQLAGAGLGGCMMALVHQDATAALRDKLQELYYEPRGLPVAIDVCTPIGGSGVLFDHRRRL